MKNRVLGLVQQAGHVDREYCLQVSEKGIRQAVAQGAQLVLLQELHGGLYFCQRENLANFSLAETIPGTTTQRLSQLARELKIVIVASIFEKRTTGVYHNTAVVLDVDGSIAGKYRKMHIPDDPGYYEKYYFTPGDLGFKPIATSLGKLGVLICWDQWFPEAARLMALAGAEILLYPTAIGWVSEDDEKLRQAQREAWMTVQQAHAVANGLPIIVCNRYGFESAGHNDKEGILFWGSSFIANPYGQILVQAPTDKDSVLVTSINKAEGELKRLHWPFLRDRRIDAYQDLLKIVID